MHKALFAGAVLCGALSLGATDALGAPILTFGQVGNGPTITATDNGVTTHIVGIDVAVDISQFFGGGAPMPAVFNLDLTSTGVINSTIIGPATLLTQAYSGTESFYTGPGLTGINLLSVTFTNFVFGLDGGSSLTMAGSEPPGSVVFTSDVLDVNTLLIPKAFANSFADVTGPASVSGTTLAGFTSSVSGVVSAQVPEPASLALLTCSVLGLFGVRSIKRSKDHDAGVVRQ